MINGRRNPKPRKRALIKLKIPVNFDIFQLPIYLNFPDIFSYSYFFEAFEASHTHNKPEQAAKNFQYMILCKIMMNSSDEVTSIFTKNSPIKLIFSTPKNHP